jgi:hypothetical protein
MHPPIAKIGRSMVFWRALLDVMQINPGVASKTDWASVAFKGASEIGVLSLTTALTGKDGYSCCVSDLERRPGARRARGGERLCERGELLGQGRLRRAPHPTCAFNTRFGWK